MARMRDKVDRPWLFIDTYNQCVRDNIAGTILIGIDFRNMHYISVPDDREHE